jgi:hypothetical protein
VIVQPVFVPQQPPPPQNGPLFYHSAMVCVTTILILTIIYQILILVILGVNGSRLEFPSNVMGGFVCAIFDLFLLIISAILFRHSKENRNNCRNAMISFVISLVLFALTYVLTFSTTYYFDINGKDYYYPLPAYYLAIQVIFRVCDLVMAINYIQKRYRFP